MIQSIARTIAEEFKGEAMGLDELKKIVRMAMKFTDSFCGWNDSDFYEILNATVNELMKEVNEKE